MEDKTESNFEVDLNSLISTKESIRIHYINELKVKLKDLNKKEFTKVIQALIYTYSRYCDKESIDSVLALWKHAYAHFSDLLNVAFPKLVAQEGAKVLKPSKDNEQSFTSPASNRYGLLTWSVCFFELLWQNEPQPSAEKESILKVIIKLFDSLANLEYVKKGIVDAALKQTKKLMIKDEVYDYLLSVSIKNLNDYHDFSLLGVLINKRQDKLTDSNKKEILDSYMTKIINSKIIVPKYVNDNLNQFIKLVINEDVFKVQLKPVLDKMILRSPEIILQTMLPLFNHLSFDLSTILSVHLADQILCLYQSTNIDIRKNSFEVFKLCCLKSNDTTQLSKVAEKLIKTLSGKIASWEQRSIIYSSCSTLIQSNKDNSILSILLKGMITLIPKETNENAFSSLMESFSTILIEFLNQMETKDNEIIKSIITLFEKGIKMDKLNFRKCYFKVIGNIILECNQKALFIISSLIPQFLIMLAKIQTSPIASTSIPMEAYVIYIVLEYCKQANQHIEIMDKNNYINLKISTIKTKNELSYFINEKVLSKLNTDEDIFWFLNAFNMLVKNYNSLSNELYAHLSRSLILVALNLTTKINVDLFLNIIKQASQSFPLQFSNTILNELESKFKIEDLKLNNNQSNTIRKMLISLFSTNNEEHNKSLLIQALIISNYEVLKPSNGNFLWISLVNHANLNIDQIVNDNSDKILDTILNNLNKDLNDNFKKSIFESVKLICFISPNLLADKFIHYAIKILKETDLSTINFNDIEIWKTPEGQLFKDVLNKNKNIKEDRNRKNYEQEKWEKEVRESLAKKNSTNKKLSKEEQLAVDNQLQLEANIRTKVKQLVNNVQHGLSLAKSIIMGLQITGIINDLNSELQVLISELINQIFNKIKNELIFDIVGDQGTQIWYTLKSICSLEMNDLPELICISTLRGYNIKVHPDWQNENLIELVSRVLFRLQMYSSRTKLSLIEFNYTLPLLLQILYNNGIGFDNNQINNNKVKDAGHDDDQPSDQMEQLLLALEIIGNHNTQGNLSGFPRKQIFDVLIFIINNQPKLYNKTLQNLVLLGESITLSDNLNYQDIQPLINGLLNDNQLIRKACLATLEPIDLAPFNNNVWANIFIEQFDNEDKDTNINKLESEMAKFLFKGNELIIPNDFENSIYQFLNNDNQHVRNTTANSFNYLAKEYPHLINSFLNNIFNLYKEFNKPIVPEYDRFGILIKSSLEKTDPYLKRISLALSLANIAYNLNSDFELSNKFLNFMIYNQVLGDSNESVRKAMLDASLILINNINKDQIDDIMILLQNYLELPDNKSIIEDYIREAVVVLYGTLAKDLKDISKIEIIMDKLITTLNTPSESVQFAVANCIPPLVKFIPEKCNTLINQLLEKSLNSEKYAIRRGAAYGIAGLVKGKGINSIKEFNIISALEEATKAKKLEFKQGAMFNFETLSELLNRLFEPYLKPIIPLLLSCFSDGSDDVRRATLNTSRVIMKNLSEYGVKLILPNLLNGLEDYQWRTKRGAVELLGSMAFCAPKQLAISLPTIVPRLILVLNDSHHQVKSAADNALNSFTNVINNPEIRSLMPKIMLALSDPDKNTHTTLIALLETPFVHYLDAPCLALIVPILQRGLKERSTDIKCKASQIVGNMASLTDPTDLIPYLNELIPDLKTILADPVPEARGTAAKSIGIMVAKLGELNFPEIINELLQILHSDSSSIDRSGAAQALSEILAGLDITRLEGLLPEIIASTKSNKSYVRESYVTLLIYLPATFGLAFKPYLNQVLPPIIKGLADESEYVRDASLRASQIIITSYSDKAVDLLLPELQLGIFESSWRIRQASAQLMGDLLFKLMGISGKVELDEDEVNENNQDINNANEGNRKALVEALGKHRRDLILSGLYIIRFDVSPKVRQVATAIWYMIVNNTPRTLKEILSVFIEQVLQLIISPHFDLEQMATHALADVIKKLGENGLKLIIPIINSKFESQSFEIRQSACLALSEMINVLGRSDVGNFLNITTNSVLKALCDENDKVRDTATKTFISLSTNLGSTAVDYILESLFKDLSSEDNPNALEALRSLVSVRPGIVLPSAINFLCVVPINYFNAKALCCLIEEGGASLNNKLKSIIIPLLESINQLKDQDNIDKLNEALELLLIKINQSGIDSLMEILFELVESNEEYNVIHAFKLLSTLFKVNQEELDIQPYVIDWMRILIPRYSIEDDILNYASNAFAGLIKSLDKSELDQLVIPLRQTVTNICKKSTAQELPGFNKLKAISPLLSIYLQGLMYSNSDIRERSANAIGELIEHTSKEALKPFVTQITGPLIRVIGERYSVGVRNAILDTLKKMLQKVPAFLKPFLPQLQRTFIKSMQDTYSENVRAKAADALNLLIELLLRFDPLVTELITNCKSAEEDIILLNYINVLNSLVIKVGDKLSQASKDSIQVYLNDNIGEFKGQVKLKAQSILKEL